MMWLTWSLASALFAAATAILAKVGIADIDLYRPVSYYGPLRYRRGSVSGCPQVRVCFINFVAKVPRVVAGAIYNHFTGYLQHRMPVGRILDCGSKGSAIQNLKRFALVFHYLTEIREKSTSRCYAAN